MKAMILGGNSPRHKQWIREVAGALEPAFEEVLVHDYASWADGSTTDVPSEIEAIKQATAQWDKFVIVAKSIGTVVATFGVASGELKADACVFMGVPLSVVKAEFANGFGLALERLPCVEFIQNEFDPYGSAAELEGYVKLHDPQAYTLTTVEHNDTHKYLDMQLIAGITSKLAK